MPLTVAGGVQRGNEEKRIARGIWSGDAERGETLQFFAERREYATYHVFGEKRGFATKEGVVNVQLTAVG